MALRAFPLFFGLPLLVASSLVVLDMMLPQPLAVDRRPVSVTGTAVVSDFLADVRASRVDRGSVSRAAIECVIAARAE